MDILGLKLLISAVFLATVLIGTYTMFEVLGRGTKRFSNEMLTRIHRINGMVALVIVLVLAGLGAAYIRMLGEELSIRAALHALMASGVVLLIIVKTLIAMRYRQFYQKLTAMGITVIFLAFGALLSSAGYYLLTGGASPKAPKTPSAAAPAKPAPRESWREAQALNVLKGKELFLARCSRCHDVDSDAKAGAPGMRGILKNPALPSTGRPATPGNIIVQLKTPYRNMPAFPDLTEEETANLIAYMKGL